MEESLRAASFSRFKKNSSSYLAVGILCGLFLILVASLSLINETLFIIAVPLLALPFLFASHISCYYLEAGQPINLSNFFRYFFGFFRPQFRGSFRGIRSFLLSLAIYVGGMVVFYFIFYFIFRSYYGRVFDDSIVKLMKTYLDDEATYSSIFSVLEENNGLLLTFIIYISAFPIPFAFTFFVYSISYASLSIYYRANMSINAGPALLRLAISNTYSRYGRSIKKAWFKLNWPVLVIPTVGAAIGATIFFLLIDDVTFLPALITLGTITFFIFFLPFYFPNMEVLYHRYVNTFKEGNQMAVEAILARIQNSIELSEEERRNLEQSFNDQDEEEK